MSSSLASRPLHASLHKFVPLHLLDDDVITNQSGIRCGPPVPGKWSYLVHLPTTIATSDDVGSTARFRCLVGYWFAPGVYQLATRCLATGRWSLQHIDCIGK